MTAGPEIDPVSARKLASLRRDFLAMTPDEAKDFITKLRARRLRPVAVRTVSSRKPKATPAPTGDSNGKVKAPSKGKKGKAVAEAAAPVKNAQD